MARLEDVRFRAGSASLSGTLTLPDGAGPFPWTLLVGSWMPRDRDGGWDRRRHPRWFSPVAPGPGLLARLADGLADAGVASLRYDPRGCGESDGDWPSTDLFTRIDDARDAIGAMRSRPELDLRRSAVLGHGEGAGIALSVAIGDPAIGAVALVGGSARSLRGVLRRGVAERSRTGRDREHSLVAELDRIAEELIERAERREPEAPLMIDGEPVALRLAAWEQGIHTPPLALATMLHRPVLLAHGADDAWSHPDESRLLAEVLAEAGNDPMLMLVDGAGHDLAEAPESTLRILATSVASRIEPRELPPVLVAIEEMRG